MPTSVLVELRFRGCDCDPTLHDVGMLSDGKHHFTVVHDDACHYLVLAVSHLN